MKSHRFLFISTLVSFAVCSILPAFAEAPISSQTKKLYESALLAVDKKDYVRAISLCQQTLKQSPTAAPVWATIARLYQITGNSTAAIAAGQKAVALSPKVAAFNADLGDYYLRGSKRDLAEKFAGIALRQDPENDVALATLATCYLASKRDKAAIPLLDRLQTVRGGKDRAIAQNLIATYLRVNDTKGALRTAKAFVNKVPTDAEALLAVVDLALRTNDRATAIAYIGKLEKQTPLSPLPPYLRGELSMTDRTRPPGEQLANAERYFQAAVNRAPDAALFQAKLGMTQLGQGKPKFDQARTHLTAALISENHNIVARRGMAILADQEERWDEAAEQYEGLLKLTPDDNTGRRRYAGVLLSGNRKEEAYRQFYELATRLPQDTVYLKELASLYMADKRFADARSAYSLLLERKEDDADALLGIAQCFSSEKKTPEARDAFNRAITANPKKETAYLLLAQLYIDDARSDNDAIVTLQRLVDNVPTSNAGRWQLIERLILAKRDSDALKQIDQLTVRSTDPNRNRYRLARGNLFLAREKWTEAVEEFEKIAAEEPDNPDVLVAVADAYTKAGRKDEATAQYEKAAKMAENVLRVAPKNTDARAVLIRVRTIQNQVEKATTFLQQVDVDPARTSK